MFRSMSSALVSLKPAGSSSVNAGLAALRSTNTSLNSAGFLAPAQISVFEQNRTLVKYSHDKGTRETLQDAVLRFYRLNCGLWIHTLPGRHKKIWRKSPEQIDKLRKHVFSRRHECKVLDKMVNKHFKAKLYLPDDIYEPYHNFKPPGHVYKPWNM